jgi:hypothetical protein
VRDWISLTSTISTATSSINLQGNLTIISGMYSLCFRRMLGALPCNRRACNPKPLLRQIVPYLALWILGVT